MFIGYLFKVFKNIDYLFLILSVVDGWKINFEWFIICIGFILVVVVVVVVEVIIFCDLVRDGIGLKVGWWYCGWSFGCIVIW